MNAFVTTPAGHSARRWAAAIALLIAPLVSQAADPSLTPAEARRIARDAYVYGFPLVDSYRIQHSYFVDAANPEYKAPWNRIKNTPRVFTPDDKAIQTPNSDTPYSFIGFDLRSEPLVLTLPAIEADRYFSVQLIDAYTHNFAYLGSRTTGNGGGSFLIAGPGWKGKTPKGIAQVVRSETEFAFALYRTQLFDAADIEVVKGIQTKYRVQPLSQFLGKKPPKAAPPVAFIQPLTAEQQRTAPQFYDVLNFVLRYTPTHPTEQALMARFARLDIGAGRKFDFGSLSPDIQAAVRQGMADAWADFGAFKSGKIDTGIVTSGDLFGTREFLANDYLKRMTGAALGIYGNSKEEAIYPTYFIDADGKPLDGAANRYTLRLEPGRLPPVDAFWSLTLYELPSSLLSANPIDRYLINSPMLPGLKRDADGGITLYIQHDSPGVDKESNWLPAPNGPFWTILRLYRPQAAAYDGSWKQPPLRAAPIAKGETVTRKTYIRAETDRTFRNIAAQAGGVNQWFYIRNPTPLDNQTVVRMNRDTLYSASIVDTSKGATVTIPKMPKGRLMSVLLVDNDHYAPAVYYDAGTYTLPTDTKYLAVVVRTQVFDPNDPAEIALVNKLQDGVKVKAASADPLPPFQWDMDSLKGLTAQYEKEASSYPSYKGMMGPRGKVDEQTRHLAAAAAWGLNPEWDATYLNYNGGFDASPCRKATYKVPENKAFWSITVYGADGYMKTDRNIVNSSSVKLDRDGRFTVHYGSEAQCGKQANRVDVTDGWNFLMRIYRPGPSVLNGKYKLPTPQPTG